MPLGFLHTKCFMFQSGTSHCLTIQTCSVNSTNTILCRHRKYDIAYLEGTHLYEMSKVFVKVTKDYLQRILLYARKLYTFLDFSTFEAATLLPIYNRLVYASSLFNALMRVHIVQQYKLQLGTTLKFVILKLSYGIFKSFKRKQKRIFDSIIQPNRHRNTVSCKRQEVLSASSKH